MTQQEEPTVGAGSRFTVVVAGVANLAIAFAKLAAGLVSGSAAMLAESAHSFADTVNQGFLLAALQRSGKQADRKHPFGYGMERYFWSLLAAIGIFVLGAGFAFYQGIEVLLVGEREAGSPLWSYVVLVVAALIEGTSLVRALWQLRSEARAHRKATGPYLLRDAEPALRAVVSEDSVAMVGIALAAGGLTLRQLTGSDVWDGIASLLIGALLVVVAVSLGRQNQQYLIGKAVDPEIEESLAEEIRRTEGIDGLIELLTMRLGPDDVLVAARVDLGNDGTGDDFEQLADELDARIQERHPEVRHVFLDPTPPQSATS